MDEDDRDRGPEWGIPDPLDPPLNPAIQAADAVLAIGRAETEARGTARGVMLTTLKRREVPEGAPAYHFDAESLFLGPWEARHGLVRDPRGDGVTATSHRMQGQRFPDTIVITSVPAPAGMGPGAVFRAPRLSALRGAAEYNGEAERATVESSIRASLAGLRGGGGDGAE